MQQDPPLTTWKKLYRSSSPAPTSASASQSRSSNAADSTTSQHAVSSSTTTATTTVRYNTSTIRPPPIHPSASSSSSSSSSGSTPATSTPCLTSSHVRPNRNRTADVIAIHKSFDLNLVAESPTSATLYTSDQLQQYQQKQQQEEEKVSRRRRTIDEKPSTTEDNRDFSKGSDDDGGDQKDVDAGSRGSRSVNNFDNSCHPNQSRHRGDENIRRDNREEQGHEQMVAQRPSVANLSKATAAVVVQTNSNTATTRESLSSSNNHKAAGSSTGKRNTNAFPRNRNDLETNDQVSVLKREEQASKNTTTTTTTTTATKYLQPTEAMSPADLFSSPISSSTSPSPTICPPVLAQARRPVPATPALSRSSSTSLLASSLSISSPPSTSSSSLSSISSSSTLSSATILPTDPSHPLLPAATVKQDTQNAPSATTSAQESISAAATALAEQQTTSSSSLSFIAGRATSIYLPDFLTGGVRYFSRKNSSSLAAPPLPSTLQPLEQQPSRTSPSSIATGSKRKESSSHSIVTDIRTINIRDISTVPTLTTFGRKRSKKRDLNHSSGSTTSSSSPSHHLRSSISSSSSSSLSSSSHSKASRRKQRVKESSPLSLPPTLVPWNLCTLSCGCARSSQSPSAADITTTSSRPAESQNKKTCLTASVTSTPLHSPTAAKDYPAQHMNSSGRTRTLSESEVQVPDRNLSVSSVKQHQQHPLRNHTTNTVNIDQQENHRIGGHPSHSQQRSTARQGQDQDRAQDIITAEIQQGPVSSHQQNRLVDSRSHSLRRKEQSATTSYTQHKRQRSPPAQMSPFEASAPSSTSSVSNMERSKRARHLTSGTQPDEPSMDSHVESMGMSQDWEWQEMNEQNHSGRSMWKQNLISPSQPQSLEHSKQDIQGHPHHLLSPTISIQSQDSSRIHPLDNDISHSTVAAAVVPSGERDESESPVHPHDISPKTNTRISPTLESLPALSVDTTMVKSPARDTDVVRPSVPQPLQSTVTTIESQSQRNKEENQQQPDRQVQSSGSRCATTMSPGPVSVVSALPMTLNLPITRDTLRELDLFEIFKNPQLRHDIVFDPHLQFRPNFDGDRGLMKRREADRFWREVGLELNNRRTILTARRETAADLHSRAGLPSASSSSRIIQQQAQQMCPLPQAVLLPRLMDELREILLSLLPAPTAQPNIDATNSAPPVNPERALLISTLDPEMLIQELDHGVLDVYALFRFLGDSLKGHCAPMRDTLVESMVTIVVDSDEIVRGIRMCFEILEWMKLDIANHQLRMLRPWLLDNSIDFEQKYFTEHLARGGTIQRTRDWFKRSWIQWEGVKQLVIGNTAASGASVPSPSNMSLARRSSTVSVSLPPPPPGLDGGDSESSMSPTSLSTFSAKRRTSVVSAEIGENILDGVVNEGLLEMIMRPHGSVNTMPETFELDHYRLLSFHNDFQDLTILCTLLILFRQLAQNCWTLQDLVEIKKVVWLLLTDENANFGSNTNSNTINGNTSTSGDATQQQSKATSPSSGMKDIVIQIEFAARKVRERSMNAAATAIASSVSVGSRRSSLSPDSPLPTGPIIRRGSVQASISPTSSLPPAGIAAPWNLKTGSIPMHMSIPQPVGTAAVVAVPVAIAQVPIMAAVSGLSAQDTNLLTAWLDNALCRTSTLYRLIQKRLLIHFRRWLYLHSCSSMLVLSASCASLASAMSMSASSISAGGESDLNGKADSEEEDEINKGPAPTCSASAAAATTRAATVAATATAKAASASTTTTSTSANQGQPSAGPLGSTTPEPTAEEANKAAAEALAAKMSFNTAEMEAHGLTGLEDEMTVLLEKVRAVSEFNKKVYGSWYRDLVKQGKAENWLEV